MHIIVDWLTIFLRWGHVLFAITWIGTSFYFNWFDLSVRETDQLVTKENVRGTLHEVHGGNFYYHEQYWPDHDQKRMLAHSGPAQLTFLSGLGLLFVIYWLRAGVFLVDPAVADISAITAVAISAGGLVLAWPLYYGLTQLLRSDRALLAGMALLVTLASWLFTQLFGARGAFIQVGAMLGTIMALNVYFVIVPNHIRMRKMIQHNGVLDTLLGAHAKRVSKHNNYITLPVLFAMLSTHFSLVAAASLNWLVLALIMLVGIILRHWRNIEHKHGFSDKRLLLLSILVAALAIGLTQVNLEHSHKQTDETVVAPAAITDAQALGIVHARCTVCHSQRPTSKQFTSAPLGFRLDTLEQLKANANRVEQRAINSHSMPLGNITGMTVVERQKLGAWINQLH